MRKSAAMKSAKPQNSRSQGPTRKRRQPVARKTVARRVKLSSIHLKPSVTSRTQSAPKSTKSSVDLPRGNGNASGETTPKTTDHPLLQLERGMRIKHLFDQGYSPSELASKFRCSMSLVS